MYTFLSKSEQETIDFANKLAEQLNIGDLIVLSGDLGAGKTKFTEGILSFFGLEKEISSPTFTIVNEYNTQNKNIYHFDVYRLSSVDEFYAIGGEEYFTKGICIIEWGELILQALPPTYIQINFERNDENPNERIIHINPIGNINKNILEIIERI